MFVTFIRKLWDLYWNTRKDSDKFSAKPDARAPSTSTSAFRRTFPRGQPFDQSSAGDWHIVTPSGKEINFSYLKNISLPLLSIEVLLPNVVLRNWNMFAFLFVSYGHSLRLGDKSSRCYGDRRLINMYELIIGNKYLFTYWSSYSWGECWQLGLQSPSRPRQFCTLRTFTTSHSEDLLN